MRTTVQFADANNVQKQGQIDIPKTCPVCNMLVQVNTQASSFTPTNEELHAVHLCTNPDCRSFFIDYYTLSNPSELFYDIRKLEPPNLTQPTFPDFVATISKTFLEIYKQAHEAKERGLNHIAGPGYRKAFEFLIKDYAKSIDASKSAEIDEAFAGKVVNDFIPDTRVHAVAKRALWVGNDEVHYTRKWVDMNVDDLINLIKLTVDWIEIERGSQEYVKSMSEKASGEPGTPAAAVPGA